MPFFCGNKRTHFFLIVSSLAIIRNSPFDQKSPRHPKKRRDQQPQRSYPNPILVCEESRPILPLWPEPPLASGHLLTPWSPWGCLSQEKKQPAIAHHIGLDTLLKLLLVLFDSKMPLLSWYKRPRSLKEKKKYNNFSLIFSARSDYRLVGQIV